MQELMLAAALFYAATLVFAAINDVRRLTIPNEISLGLAAGAPAWHLAAGTPALASALGAGAVLAAGILLFARGFVGGGDAKLAAAVALWLPTGSLGPFLLWTSLAGGVLAAALLTLPVAQRAIGRDRVGALPDGGSLPYGVAITAGGLVAFPWDLL